MARYNGPGDGIDDAWDVAASPDGSRVYVTGSSLGADTDDDAATIAYDAATGAKVWATRYDGPAHLSEGANAIAVDTAGTVYVAGYTFVSQAESDMLALAYNGSTGTQEWVGTYVGTGGSSGGGWIGVDPGGQRVFVTGSSLGSGTGNDIATVAFSSAGGSVDWVDVYNGPDSQSDDPYGWRWRRTDRRST